MNNKHLQPSETIKSQVILFVDVEDLIGDQWSMRRIKAKGVGYYHCMSRIVAGERLLEGGAEKTVLRKMIWDVAEFCGVRVLTYVVMSNHFHVLLEVPVRREVGDVELVSRYRCLYAERRSECLPSPEQLGSILEEGGEHAEWWRQRLLARMFDVSHYMKALKQRFTVFYNRRHGRFGTLWAERFNSVLVEGSPSVLSTVAAYIDLNPVRAGLARDPADYHWSGFGEAMGGHPLAREGIASAMEPEQPDGWKGVVARYRVLLYGKGAASRSTSAAGRIDPKRVLAVLEGGGRVSLAELLRCRVRYFTRSTVLGSQAFVESWLSAEGIPRKPKPLGPWRQGTSFLEGETELSLAAARGMSDGVTV